jgi:hypothetical protein
MAACLTFGQRIPDSQVKVRTICEVLGDVRQYADAAVAVVGQLERSVSLIDHYEYLSQDRCGRPVVTSGHKRSNKIQTWTNWEEGMPQPPRDSPKLNQAVVAAKLSVVRRTTRLGFHQEPRFKTEGRSITYSHTVTVPNEWAVVYGRIMRLPAVDEDSGSGGSGGDHMPLMVIAEPHQVHKLTDTGKLLPERR